MQRRPDIDWLKGFAILCVLLIHAEPLVGTAVHEHLINRAVPIFLVLFGVTSEYWWAARAHASFAATARLWYTTRLRRLMIPIWGMLAVWWIIELAFDPQAPRSLSTGLMTAIGYMPWIGTGWFVTLILELVLLFPLLRLCVERLGGTPSLLAALVILVVSHLYSLEVIGFMRVLLRDSAPVSGFFVFYYLWIFAPARFFALIAGMLIARRTEPFSWGATFLAALALTGGAALQTWGSANPHAHAAVQAAMDVPLTILLLSLIPAVRAWQPAAAALAWCGTASWGLYLGQLLVHTSVRLFGFHSEIAPAPQRWAYVVCLLVGAVGFLTIGEALRAVRPGDWLPGVGSPRK